MQINILWPLKWLPWATYAAIIAWVQIILIIPLSTILWQEFYHQLIPVESRYEGQTQPVLQSNYDQQPSIYSWHLTLDRRDGFTAQPVSMSLVSSNSKEEFPSSLSQLIVPKNIFYFLNLEFQVYCFDAIPIHNIEVMVGDEIQFFTVSCFPDIKLAAEQSWGSKPMSERIQIEFMNHFTMPGIVVSSNDTQVKVTLRSTSKLLFGQNTRFDLNMELSGPRYIMLRWNKLCHVFGTAAFVGVISGCFYVTFTIGFVVFGFVRNKSTTNTKN